jgi:hypothetical protein
MAQYITKIRTEDGDKQIDYNALANKPTAESMGAALENHKHKVNEITDFPTSLPANGGNADTVDGKHASDFALVSDLDSVIKDLENSALASDVNVLKSDVDTIKSDVNDLQSDISDVQSNLDNATINMQAQLDGKALAKHEHSAADITSGILAITRGGIGSSNGATGLKNLFAAGNTVLSSHQYGNSLPAAGTNGRIFFKKVSS